MSGRYASYWNAFLFAVVNSFDANNAISANLVQTVKNSIKLTGELETNQVGI